MRRILLADDERLARARLRQMLGRHRDYEIVAECMNGRETVDAILDLRPDIVLLDVKMPELDGFEVLAALENIDPAPAVVFVTASDAHAIRAFEVSAVDYLLKPINQPRFDQALARAEERLAGGDRRIQAAASRYLASLGAPEPYPERFLVRGAKHLYFVRAADIEWADASQNYVRFHIGGKVHLVRDTMTAIEGKLTPDRFVRVHRSVIVNLDFIERLAPREHGQYTLTMADGSVVRSSRGYSQRLRELLR